MKLITHSVRAAAVAVASLAAIPQSVLAETVITTILKTELEGMEGMEANVVLFDVDPGWQTPSHIHPGQLFVYVLEGGLELSVEGHETVTVGPGEVVYETPDVPMVGRNLSSTERAKLLVFQFGEAGEPLMIAQE